MENIGFADVFWFSNHVGSSLPAFKNIGKTYVIRELGAPSHMA